MAPPAKNLADDIAAGSDEVLRKKITSGTLNLIPLTSDGRNVLHHCLWKGTPMILKILLFQNKIKPADGLRSVDKKGNTVFHILAENKNMQAASEMLHLIVEFSIGAFQCIAVDEFTTLLKAENKDGTLPQNHGRKSVELISLYNDLLAFDDFSHKDNLGETPVKVAKKQPGFLGHLSMIALVARRQRRANEKFFVDNPKSDAKPWFTVYKQLVQKNNTNDKAIATQKSAHQQKMKTQPKDKQRSFNDAPYMMHSHISYLKIDTKSGRGLILALAHLAKKNANFYIGFELGESKFIIRHSPSLNQPGNMILFWVNPENVLGLRKTPGDSYAVLLEQFNDLLTDDHRKKKLAELLIARTSKLSTFTVTDVASLGLPQKNYYQTIGLLNKFLLLHSIIEVARRLCGNKIALDNFPVGVFQMQQLRLIKSGDINTGQVFELRNFPIYYVDKGKDPTKKKDLSKVYGTELGVATGAGLNDQENAIKGKAWLLTKKCFDPQKGPPSQEDTHKLLLSYYGGGDESDQDAYSETISEPSSTSVSGADSVTTALGAANLSDDGSVHDADNLIKTHKTLSGDGEASDSEKIKKKEKKHK